MARIKIDYGIDLGTTNSSICRMEKGEPVVIKTDIQKTLCHRVCLLIEEAVFVLVMAHTIR